jgi:hypothetical protein
MCTQIRKRLEEKIVIKRAAGYYEKRAQTKIIIISENMKQMKEKMKKRGD